MALTHNLGFPRIGAKRELKKALETYWSGESNEVALQATAGELRQRHWQLQKDIGINLVPVGDFALYDHMLNMTALLGAVPTRFQWNGNEVGLDTYFAMARGTPEQPAMEMTKWFDTNYHYIVPEFTARTEFSLGWHQLFQEVTEAQEVGVQPKVVLVGPLTYLYLGKETEPGFNRLSLLSHLLPVYEKILGKLASLGVKWVQFDEPALVLDLPDEWRNAYEQAYAFLQRKDINLLLATYFEAVDTHASRLKRLPVAGLHLDLCRAPNQLSAFLNDYPQDKVLSLGVIDGRNVWRNDLEDTYDKLLQTQSSLGDRLWIAPSCSLLHCPVDLDSETKLDAELKSWLAFSAQKLREVAALARGLNEGKSAISKALQESAIVKQGKASSARIHNPVVQRRLQNRQTADSQRTSSFSVRQAVQARRFNLPLFPTTTIGSFPQTTEIRSVRAAYKSGAIGNLKYLEAMRTEIGLAIERQESIGLDVLVHGEAERNDMVEYFGEQLYGYAFTENGWVQSYGSRCVKPPIIYGDVYRPDPMTVDWILYAQSLSDKPVKGMLTGPITMLQWSFVRDDQPRATTALQIAYAIRDEVVDLEKAGIGIIQIDEPALREGLPLKNASWDDYLRWAVDAFRVTSAGVRDDTQIHTHMCYSEFNDVLPSIAAMDADVITIETSRSRMELLDGFSAFKYPNEIGPGVYDIHSPRIPSLEEMLRLLQKACDVINPQLLWVNPDCGLKTRRWPETEVALRNMVEAAKLLRAQHAPVAAAHG
ncbi:MAG: 5-methyltetrahydropteroyltriglutamate--homocysteine S-methyltransferase [Pseudomonadota bacterium]